MPGLIARQDAARVSVSDGDRRLVQRIHPSEQKPARILR